VTADPPERGGDTVPAAGAPKRILIIKLGALGDFVQALGPIQAIRRHHPAARITLLTTAPFSSLAAACPWIDDIRLDERPAWWRIPRWMAFRRWIRQAGFARIYDLQTSDRSGWYFRLMGRPHAEWSGIVSGCSHPHANPERDFMHTVDRQAEQLAVAGIAAVPAPDLAWLDDAPPAVALSEPFVLMVPGGAAHRPAKRWPAPLYGELANRLLASGYQPVLAGAAADRTAIAEIFAACPGALDLTGQTSLLQLGGLARRAAAAVGNDTGPMHLAAAVGCRAVVLFSDASDPALCAPRGGDVAVLRQAPLADLAVAEVEAALRLR
jgi:ADP-heptose:LPS heptosyltransferase